VRVRVRISEGVVLLTLRESHKGTEEAVLRLGSAMKSSAFSVSLSQPRMVKVSSLRQRSARPRIPRSVRCTQSLRFNEVSEVSLHTPPTRKEVTQK
jgi:hypothetical protein